MSREKQIEEMAQHLWVADENHDTFDIRGNYHDLAEALYNAGYRKQSEVERLERILNSYALQYGTVMDKHIVIERARAEVAREIFEEIESILCISEGKYTNMPLKDAIAILKKKYTENAE